MKDTGLQPGQMPANMTAADFTRAVAVATVSALRHQHAQSHSPARPRVSGVDADEHGGGHGGHDAPSWSRAFSATVLLGCTFLYAVIAGASASQQMLILNAYYASPELLIDVIDVVLEGSGIDEKLLGITLLALVPNTTEFMNAMAFAMGGNIALSMEIGSAYALQVCLLQIPAMVAFSAWRTPGAFGQVRETFTYVLSAFTALMRRLTSPQAHLPPLGRHRYHPLSLPDDLHIH
jgi:Ca2+:H+ antiporter